MPAWKFAQREEDKMYQRFELVEPVAGIIPGEMKFIVLPGSGAGDQLIFQGYADLGEGKRLYNLTVFAYAGRPAHSWQITEIRHCALHGVSMEVMEKGIPVAKALADSLPEDISSVGARHKVNKHLKGVKC